MSAAVTRILLPVLSLSLSPQVPLAKFLSALPPPSAVVAMQVIRCRAQQAVAAATKRSPVQVAFSLQEQLV